MDTDLIDEAANAIAVAASTGPGQTPGSKVVNNLSPHFKHYTTERIRSVVHQNADAEVAKFEELMQALHAALLEEDNKLGNVLAPVTLNGDAVRAIATDCAKHRLQLIEGLHIQVRALLRNHVN